MEKMQRLEELVLSLTGYPGVARCAVMSRLGQGDVLYDWNFGELDRPLLSAMVSSLLMIGEKFGQELDCSPMAYHLLAYGSSKLLMVPGDEDVALLVSFEGDGEREPFIDAARRVAVEIGDLFRNRATGT